MKSSKVLIHNIKTGKINLTEKTYLITFLSKNDKKKINELKNLTYKDIVKKYQTSFKQLSAGIFAIKIDKEQIIVCLIDKNLENYVNYCKKNKIKYNEEDLKNTEKVNKNAVKSSSNEKINDYIKQGNNYKSENEYNTNWNKNINPEKYRKINKEEDEEMKKERIKKMREMKVDKNVVKRSVKKAVVVGISAVMGMSLFACKKAETINTYKPIQSDYVEQTINESEQRATLDVKPFDLTPKVLDNSTGATNRPNMIKELPDHEIRNTYINGTEYFAKLEDEKDWPIGPHGWPEPPEEFKTRPLMKIKNGAVLDAEDQNFVDTARRGWTVIFKVGDTYYGYRGSDDYWDGREIVRCEPNKNGIIMPTDDIILDVDGSNKESFNELLGYIVTNDSLVNQITGGRKIKNSLK